MDTREGGALSFDRGSPPSHSWWAAGGRAPPCCGRCSTPTRIVGTKSRFSSNPPMSCGRQIRRSPESVGVAHGSNIASAVDQGAPWWQRCERRCRLSGDKPGSPCSQWARSARSGLSAGARKRDSSSAFWIESSTGCVSRSVGPNCRADSDRRTARHAIPVPGVGGIASSSMMNQIGTPRMLSQALLMLRWVAFGH